MAETKAKKSQQPDKEERADEADDKLVIHDSTASNQEEPEAHPADELEGKDLGKAPEDEAAEPQETPAEEPKDETIKQPTNAPASKKRFTWTRKKIIAAVVIALVVIVGVLAAIPTTRYGVAGLFVKRNVAITLHDSKTNKPVSSVAIEIGDVMAITDAKGTATLKSVPVGSKKIAISKKNYKSFTTEETVGILGNDPTFDFAIEATGRQVPVTVLNKVSQKPLEGVDITADGTSSKTDKNGEAVIVLPADKDTVDAVITGPGYNKAAVSITVTEQKDDKNTFAAVPTGKLYFLSKRSGTIDVLKSDLDGSNVETVLKGTGKEDDRSTVLLASRDWKHLALKATRDSDTPKLYLVDAASGKLSVMDEGEANFTPNGWYNNYFIYTVERTNVKNWEQKKYALKSYNASSGSLNTLDESMAVGSLASYSTENFGRVYLLGDNQIFYTKNWYGNLGVTKNNTINTIQPDGGNKKIVQSLATADGYYNTARLYKPNEVYLASVEKGKDVVWEYEDGLLKKSDDLDINKVYDGSYPTFLLSPAGTKTFWSEPRDGKNTLFVGDKDANKGKEVASLSDYTPYGWYGEDYLLVSKGGSELYIMSVANPSNVVKVTDYHKPNTSFAGYGYGYGGL